MAFSTTETLNSCPWVVILKAHGAKKYGILIQMKQQIESMKHGIVNYKNIVTDIKYSRQAFLHIVTNNTMYAVCIFLV